jgi:type I restriction enzyme S subunit
MSQGNGKLPAGWRTAKLGDLIVEAATGFACGQRANDGVIQLRMNNVTRRGELDWSSFIRVPIEKAMLDDYALRAGDVVFNNTNSTEMVGKTALFDDFDEPVVFSNHFTRLRTKPDTLAPDFLALWLHTQWQAGLFARICDRWIGQSAVQRNKLLALEIPVPPLKEQRRIAVRLREQLSILAQARTALEVQLAAAESLPAAHLRAVFESEEAGLWPAKKLGDVCHRIEYGFTASADFTINDPRFLRITDIQNGRVEWTDVPGCKIAEREIEQHGLKDGDIVFARTGATTGKSFLIRDPPRAVFASYLIRLRLRNDVIPAFIAFFLQSDSYWRQIRAGARGGAQPNFNGSMVARIELRLPPIEIQRALAARLDSEFSAADALGGAISAKLADVEKLPAALLREAFSPRGEVD